MMTDQSESVRARIAGLEDEAAAWEVENRQLLTLLADAIDLLGNLVDEYDDDSREFREWNDMLNGIKRRRSAVVRKVAFDDQEARP